MSDHPIYRENSFCNSFMISLRACFIDCFEISISGTMFEGFDLISSLELDAKAVSILSNLASTSFSFS